MCMYETCHTVSGFVKIRKLAKAELPFGLADAPRL
jgi:hypothetical protein